MLGLGVALAIGVCVMLAGFLQVSRSGILLREQTELDAIAHSIVTPVQADMTLMIRMAEAMQQQAVDTLARRGVLTATDAVSPGTIGRVPSLIALYLTDPDGRIVEGYPMVGDPRRDAGAVPRAGLLRDTLTRSGGHPVVQREPWGTGEVLQVISAVHNGEGSLAGMVVLRLAVDDVADQVFRAFSPWRGWVGVADADFGTLRWFFGYRHSDAPPVLDPGRCVGDLERVSDDWFCFSTSLIPGGPRLLVALPEQALLGDWQSDMTMVVLLAGGGAILTVVLFAAIGLIMNRLFDNERGFYDALQSCPDAIAIIRSTDNTVTFVNDGFVSLTGWTPADVLGRRPTALGLWAPEGGDADLPELIRAQGGLSGYGLEVISRGGERLSLLLSAAVIPVAGLDQIIVFAKDVGPLRQTQLQLQATVERLVSTSGELERFAHAAAHDLQEPLRSIVSFSQLLQMHLGQGLPPAAQEDLHFITTSARRMHDLVHGLLEYAQMTAAPGQFESCSLNSLVETALDLLKPFLDDGQARIIVPPLPTVIGCPPQLTRVFRHILGNALKFRTATHPCSIEIAWHPVRHAPAPLVHVSIRDNGIGMTADQVAQAFELFRRFHTWTEYPGNGAGLALCRHIITQHGGDIWLESTPRQGTVVHLTLQLDVSVAIPSRSLRGMPAADPGAETEPNPESGSGVAKVAG